MLIENPLVLDATQTYTFSRYIEINYPTQFILEDLGYSHERSYLNLPEYKEEIDFIENLSEDLISNLSHITLVNETSRREALISPIIFKVIKSTNTYLNIEFPVQVNQYLRGTLDYYLSNKQNLIIIEAKNADIVRGFTQLSVELIALDLWLGSRNKNPYFYGAVTTGEDWRFAKYLREEKKIFEDINLYHAPDKLEQLIKILTGILVYG